MKMSHDKYIYIVC